MLLHLQSVTVNIACSFGGACSLSQLACTQSLPLIKTRDAAFCHRSAEVVVAVQLNQTQLATNYASICIMLQHLDCACHSLAFVHHHGITLLSRQGRSVCAFQHVQMLHNSPRLNANQWLQAVAGIAALCRNRCSA